MLLELAVQMVPLEASFRYHLPYCSCILHYPDHHSPRSRVNIQILNLLAEVEVRQILVLDGQRPASMQTLHDLEAEASLQSPRPERPSSVSEALLVSLLGTRSPSQPVISSAQGLL